MNTETPRTNQAVLQSDGQWSFVLRDCSQELERELTAVTEQRDAVTLRLGNTQERMFNAERQRDRLAEALERILEYQGTFAEEDPESIATEALQYLVTNHFVDTDNMVEITTLDHFPEVGNMIENNHN